LLEVFFDQVSDDFGISFRNELMIFFSQFVFEFQVVLDNAVVDDDDAAGAIAMGMRILLSGSTVRGPTRVAHAIRAIERPLSQGLFKVPEFALGAANLKIMVLVDDGDAR
jgi:hypothetical protein